MPAEYGDITELMTKENIMPMKRGLSANDYGGDDQYVLNYPYDFAASKDRTGNLGSWEELVTKLAKPFMAKGSTFMVDDNHFD